jgi:hypothetical protein
MKVPDSMAWTEFSFEQCVELVTASHHRSELARAAPGCVVRHRYAHLELHFAPRRWLLVEPDESLIAGLLSSGARCWDASGKWKLFTAELSNAGATLAAAIDLKELLSHRGCARAHLFDCPVVLAQLDNVFLACVESSYEASWLAATRLAASAPTR